MGVVSRVRERVKGSRGVREVSRVRGRGRGKKGERRRENGGRVEIREDKRQ